MPRLIDVDALIAHHCDGCKEEIQEICKQDPVCATLMWLLEAPTVDAVEVVRCEECEEADKTCVWSKGILFCNMWQTCTFDAGYCHHGRRGTNAAD